MYSLPKTAAEIKANVEKAYSKPMSKNITESGKYNLMIDVAIWTDFGGWKGLELHFIDENEQKTCISLTYEDKDGKRFFGADTLDSIMVTTGVKNLTAAPDSYVMWSKVEQSFTEQDVNGCPELKGKWVTGLLQAQLDAYNGNDGVRETQGMRIYGIYQAKTELSANEIMDKVTIANDVHEALANLEKTPLFITKRHKTLMGAKPVQQSTGYGSAGKATEDLDDDLPF